VLAFLIGSTIAGIGVASIVVGSDYGARISTGGMTWICIWCLLGGFAAGWALRRDLLAHGWRLLWLAAVSPALPIWIFAVGALLMGVEMEENTLRWISLACAVSTAGSLGGYYFGGDWKYRLAGDPRFRSVAKSALAFFAGILAFFLCCIFILSFIEPLDRLGGTFVVGLFMLWGLPPFLGGFASGALMVWVPLRDRWRYLRLAVTSPAFPLLFLGSVSIYGFPMGLSPVNQIALICGGCLVLPVLGSIVGYRFTLWRKTSSQAQAEDGTLDEGVNETADEDG
jgi:hypothetical protein